MWIRNEIGNYINADNVYDIKISPLKSGDVGIRVGFSGTEYNYIAMFNTKEEAQEYLDRMMKVVGEKIWEVNKEDWEYTGHKKDRKEKRRGGS